MTGLLSGLVRGGAVLAGLGTVTIGGLSLLSGAGTPDFMQAYMLNQMTGRGGYFKTLVWDGLKSFLYGSRTASAMFSGGFGNALMMNPYMMGMMNPMMMGGLMNPAMMGMMGYNPMMMGSMMWGGY